MSLATECALVGLLHVIFQVNWLIQPPQGSPRGKTWPIHQQKKLPINICGLTEDAVSTAMNGAGFTSAMSWEAAAMTWSIVWWSASSSNGAGWKGSSID